jgi:hypothetical protein
MEDCRFHSPSNLNASWSITAFAAPYRVHWVNGLRLIFVAVAPVKAGYAVNERRGLPTAQAFGMFRKMWHPSSTTMLNLPLSSLCVKSQKRFHCELLLGIRKHQPRALFCKRSSHSARNACYEEPGGQ